LDKIIAALWV